MAQMQRQPDSPRTPATPTTVEQLLRASKRSPKSPLSSNSMFARDHDLENDHSHHHKKSVLMKMKDKAKKLRNSFNKRRHGEDAGNVNPSWGAHIEDDNEEEDAEYHGAPMYESEMAPDECHKDNARNHQNPKLFSGKNVLTCIKSKSITSTRENTHSPNKDKAVAVTANVVYNPSSPNKPCSPNKPPSPSKGAASIKPPSPRQLINQTNAINNKFPSPRKSATPSVGTSSPSKATTQFAGTSSLRKMTSTKDSYKGRSPSKSATGGTAESVADKPAPPYPAVSDATHAITTKIQGVAILNPVIKKASSASAPVTPQNSSASVTTYLQPDSAPAGTAKEDDHSKDHIWDKGVSVKEYIMNKFEPGEDERALSRVISEAMSPCKTPGEAGVVDKVREAVSSLLRNDNLSKRSINTQSANHSSTQTPVSANPQKVCDQEENQGRILQAN